MSRPAKATAASLDTDALLALVDSSAQQLMEMAEQLSNVVGEMRDQRQPVAEGDARNDRAAE